MKTLLFIAAILLASCSDNDPEPQVSCEVLQVQLNTAQKAILDHQSEGSNGNQSAWESELKKLISKRDGIKNEITKRHCL